MTALADVIGVAGCGAMGLPMAEALVRAGNTVWGHDVRPAAEFGQFADRMIADAVDFAARCDVVISVVRDVAQTEALLFGEQAVLLGDPAPHTLVVSSTLSPRYLRDLASRMPDATVLVDAPMSGAPVAAREASLSFMLGGDDATLDRLMPAFEAMGGRIFRLGPVSAGMTAKVLNNYIAASSVVAVRRALARARALDADLDALRAVISASSGGTWFGDRLDVIDWAREAYSPSNTLGILEKDVRASLDALLDSTEPAIAADGFDEALIEALRALPTMER